MSSVSIPFDLLSQIILSVLHVTKPDIEALQRLAIKKKPLAAPGVLQRWREFLQQVTKLRVVSKCFNDEVLHLNASLTACYIFPTNDLWTISNKKFNERKIGSVTTHINIRLPQPSSQDIHDLCDILGSCKVLHSLSFVTGSTSIPSDKRVEDTIKQVISTNKDTLRTIIWDSELMSPVQILLQTANGVNDLCVLNAPTTHIENQSDRPNPWSHLKSLRLTGSRSQDLLIPFVENTSPRLRDLAILSNSSIPHLRELLVNAADSIQSVIAVYPLYDFGNGVPPLPNLVQLSLHLLSARENLQNPQPSLETFRIFGMPAENALDIRVEREGRVCWFRRASVFMNMLVLILRRLIHFDFFPSLRTIEIEGYPRSIDRLLVSGSERALWTERIQNLQKRGVQVTANTIHVF